MLTSLLAGAGVGLGAVAVMHGVAPRKQRLATALRALDDPSRRTSGALGLARAMVEGVGVDLGALRDDLRVCARTPERHALDKVVTATAFLALPPGSAAVLGMAGIGVSAGLVVVAAVVLAALGFLAPDLIVRSEARRRRREFRHALGAYLDLVAIVVAGGGGTETALYSAVGVGRGWAFTELERTLAACRLAAEPPWTALDRLGRDLGIDELREVAASVGLAGEYGAKVRHSLGVRAASMRDHRLAEVEADAQAATEKMSIPVVLMLFGFVAFVMYPALQLVLAGL